MRKFALILVVGMLAACCPKNGKDGLKGDKGDRGNVGTPGAPGNDGSNGHNALVSQAEADSSLCLNGGSVMSFGTDLDDDGLLCEAETSQVAIICNGTNGADGDKGDKGDKGDQGDTGQDGMPTAFTPVAILNPCGDAPGVYDEVFLKLQNGTILASFSANQSGLNTRWAILTPGTYVTTDGNNCTFTINAAGTFTYESHHN